MKNHIFPEDWSQIENPVSDLNLPVPHLESDFDYPIPAALVPAPVVPAPSAVFYANCAAAKASGAAPILTGQPGYRAGLDRDLDGVACES